MVGLVSIAVMFAVGVFVFVCAAVIGFGWGEKVGLAVLFVSGLAAASTCLHLASYSPPGNLENAADWDRELESLEHRLAILDIVLCFFGIGAAVFFASAGWRVWTHRRTLFSFLYRDSGGQADEPRLRDPSPS